MSINGGLVVLSSQLHGRTKVLREAPRARRPSDLEPGRDRPGRPAAGPEATLPALYIVGSNLNLDAHAGADTIESDGAAVQTTVHLTKRCSG